MDTGLRIMLLAIVLGLILVLSGNCGSGQPLATGCPEGTHFVDSTGTCLPGFPLKPVIIKVTHNPYDSTRSEELWLSDGISVIKLEGGE